MNTPRWLTTKEAAKYLGLHPDSLRRYRRLGRGPRYAKVGRLIRYDIDKLDAWLRANEAVAVQGGAR